MSHCLLSRWRTAAVALLVALVAVVPAQVAPAAPLDQVGSLKLVPQDVAFYACGMRLREQIEAVVHSNAVKSLTEMPEIKEAIEQLKEQLDSPDMAVPRAMLELPENKALIEMLGDMVSDEIFFYGDQNWVEMMALLQDVSHQMRVAQLEGGGELDEEQILEMLEGLAEQLGDSEIPVSVMGFLLEDTEQAANQLKRLEVFATLICSQVEELEGRLKRQTIGAAEYITFTLDGDMIPWGELLSEIDEPEQREVVEKLVDVVKEKTLTFSLGIHGDYLIFSIGETSDHLSSLGAGKTLASHPKIKALGKYAGERLTDVNYLSAEFAAAANSMESQIDDLVGLVSMGIEQESDLPADKMEPLVADIEKLAEEIKQVLPTPGAMCEVAFLTPRGIEGYAVNYTHAPAAPAPKKLTILDHVSPNPLLLIAGRSEVKVKDYKRFAHWVGRAIEHFDNIAVPEMSKKERREYQQARDFVMPLLERLDKTNAEMLLPALADGQSALVVDAHLTDKQWCDEMAEAAEPLPLPIPSLVLGVSDAELLKQAYSEYVDVINQIAAKLHEIDPDEVPEWQFPSPEEREVSGGAVYTYRIPAELGISGRLAPAIGLSDDVAVLTLSPRHAKGMLRGRPLKLQGPLSDLDRPLLGAVYFNWAGIVGAAEPWVNYAIDQEFGELRTAAGASQLVVQEDEAAKARRISKTVMDVLKCFKSISAVVTKEGDATVTHYELHIEDLK